MHSNYFCPVLFSKSFGYALRAILYMAAQSEMGSRTRLDVIAKDLVIPRYFLEKVMKRLVKGNVLGSKKGVRGGFYVMDHTLDTSLLKLVELTGERQQTTHCVLQFQQCNASHPCPLHHSLEAIKRTWEHVLSSTTVLDLLDKEKPGFLKSLGVEQH